MSETAPPENWILMHPVYLEMKSLGVEDSEQIHAAFLSYMDLTEVRQWKEVSCLKSSELQMVLLEAREKEGGPILSVYPVPIHRFISHKNIRSVMGRGFPVLLCAVASDSTLVYQMITNDLMTPDPRVGPIQDVGRRQHRKRHHQP